jgi:hypothetical protein
MQINNFPCLYYFKKLENERHRTQWKRIKITMDEVHIFLHCINNPKRFSE